MPRVIHVPYSYHVKNIRCLEDTLCHISRSAKHYIRLRNHKQVTFFNRLYLLTLVAWTEVRFHKLLCEPNAFSEQRRNSVLEQSTQYDRWLEIINVAFQKKYECSLNRLPATRKLQHKAIVNLMETHLKPIITLRNKLAHGQWIYTFNNNSYELDTESKQAIEKENIMSLQYKKTLLTAIATIVNDLVLSKPTFERDFDLHYKKIEDVERDLSTRKYKSYVQSLLARHQRGLERQRAS